MPAAAALDPQSVGNIGSWPISTDWDGREDHAKAFAAHWGRWKAKIFKIIIAEHDEPDQLGLDRYRLFVRTGMIYCHGDSVQPSDTFE